MPIAFLIFVLWIISGIFHQALYLLLPILGFIYGWAKDFKFNLNKVTRPYFLLFLTFGIILLFQILNNHQLTLYNLEGLSKPFVYFSFGLFVFGINSETLKKIMDLIIWYVILSIPYGIYLFLQGERFANFFPHYNHYAYVLVVLLLYIL